MMANKSLAAALLLAALCVGAKAAETCGPEKLGVSRTHFGRRRPAPRPQKLSSNPRPARSRSGADLRRRPLGPDAAHPGGFGRRMRQGDILRHRPQRRRPARSGPPRNRRGPYGRQPFFFAPAGDEQDALRSRDGRHRARRGGGGQGGRRQVDEILPLSRLCRFARRFWPLSRRRTCRCSEPICGPPTGPR